MKCDACGCHIPEGQGVQTTRSEQTGPPNQLGARTSTHLVTICAGCARRRSFWGWLAGLALAVIVLGGIAILISEFVRNR
jgi:hypothetical protein